MSKTIKISEDAHKELKLFSVKSDCGMEALANNAILEYVAKLSERLSKKQSKAKKNA